MKKKIKYSLAIKELNEILEELQSERVDVDEVSLKVKRAIELIRLCTDKIQKTEMEVKKVIKDLEKEVPLSSLEGEEELEV
ncbi:MAG: exodeoxyribonuclease VII small subunit [Candidatus Omnitrophota bacterium]|nr:exodeoxyribonuclease VII small subunit [Candidatus Omnitrophota bacterium]RKY29531.1 MAG: exodeoxyribonuclease VII small subunit [Candidatus Omnitrophota bacterium]RKY36387.1 MAG: exodeoxyribonuclease VII small subunit [Candidatus Omnitrophota bacterium]RKY43698.1 MAG: exodeoxyribonuclease VII small subunit [Candidatus Omnitrophota bacterium]